MNPIHLVINAMSTRPGGGLTVLLGLIKGLQNQQVCEVRTTVVCSADGTREGVEEQGIAEVQQPLQNAGGIKRQLWVTRKMGKYLRSISPDVFLSINQFVPSVSCPQVVYHINLLRFMPVDKNASLKTKVFEHLRNYSAKQALKKCQANVFESAYIQQCAEKVYDSGNPNDCVIYIGLPDSLASATSTGQAEFDPAQICSITNGNPHKDNTTLMKTMAELVEARPDVDWKLKIAGGLYPELWEPYKRLATDLGVLDRIQWVGFMNQDQLGEMLRSSLCLVATSRVESFCMVALESMARGCPPIVADCAAMPESVGEAALLAQPGDAKGFANSVIKFHDEPSFRKDLVERGFEHVRKFRWDVCGQQFAGVISVVHKQVAN